MGAAACLVLLAGTTGCGSGAVEVDPLRLGAADAAACEELLDALPARVAGQPTRAVQPEDAPAAAWGDPAIVLRCGTPPPRGLDEFSSCHEANGVGWFVPDEQVEDQGMDVVMTTIGFEQNVEVFVPASYRPPTAAMVDLAPAIKQAIREVRPCA